MYINSQKLHNSFVIYIFKSYQYKNKEIYFIFRAKDSPHYVIKVSNVYFRNSVRVLRATKVSKAENFAQESSVCVLAME